MTGTPQDPASPDTPNFSGTPVSQDLEVAHVLFMDIIAFTNLDMENQRKAVATLQQIVRETQSVSHASRINRLISLPTGDGMALAFFGDPTQPLRCAIEIAASVSSRGSPELRMGINTGPVYRISDVNANLNVSGAGINVAQRIMDAGDSRHILLSKSTADTLLQFGEWAAQIHDLGEHEVKHGVRLRFFNFYDGNVGNPAVPDRFFAERRKVRRQWSTRMTIGAAIAAAIFVGVEANTFHIGTGTTRRSVAVLGFRNLTGRPEADWISTDLAEGIRTQLAGNGKLRTMAGQQVSDMNRDLGITTFDSLAGPTLARVRKFGADIVVLGSYTAMNGRVTLNVELQDTAKQETTDALQADAQDSDLSVLIAQVGSRLRGKLGVGELSADRERQLAMAQPQPEAAPAYAEGLALLRIYDAIGAQRLLSRAALADPRFPFVHHYLASALHILGYDSRAREEAKRAFDVSGKLALEDRLVIEGSFHEMSQEWTKAAATYEQLHAYYPDQLEYALALARSQRLGGKLKAALDGLAGLQHGRTAESTDPRIDLEIAEAATALRKYAVAGKAADSAAEKANEIGSKMLASRALFWKCIALRRERRFDEALPVCTRAASQAEAIGDRLGRARALIGVGNCLSSKGDHASAAAKFQEAVQITREMGTMLDEAGALNNLAFAFVNQKKLTEGEATFRSAIAIQQQIGVKSEELRSENGLCGVLESEGRLRDAEGACRKAIDLASEVGDKNGLAIGLTTLASIQGKLGQNAQATASLARARELKQATGK